MNTVSEEQVLFNKLSYEEQQFILKQMRMLQPCEISCEIENKIPKKSVLDTDNDVNGSYDIVIINGIEYEINKVERYMFGKINEIIDYLDYLESKGE